mgnify:CR=1 FL=1
MFTRYIRDEEGNKRVYDTWESGCPKNSMTAAELRRHYPNATEGLEFCTRFSGDDWTYKGDTRISPAYWELPDFVEPDLVAPRELLTRRVTTAKSREDIEAAAKAA